MFVAGQHLAGALENFPLWQFLNQKFYFLTWYLQDYEQIQVSILKYLPRHVHCRLISILIYLKLKNGLPFHIQA
jgi:hypothetical protein